MLWKIVIFPTHKTVGALNRRQALDEHESAHLNRMENVHGYLIFICFSKFNSFFESNMSK